MFIEYKYDLKVVQITISLLIDFLISKEFITAIPPSPIGPVKCMDNMGEIKSITQVSTTIFIASPLIGASKSNIIELSTNVTSQNNIPKCITKYFHNLTRNVCNIRRLLLHG